MLEVQKNSKSISQKMLELGIRSKLQGYNYLISSIIRTSEDPKVVTSVTKLLYPDIAKEFKVTPKHVERAIRHAIESGWERGNTDLQEELFGYSRVERTRPTNSEFIAVLAAAIDFNK